jgi:hypothetical protein
MGLELVFLCIMVFSAIFGIRRALGKRRERQMGSTKGAAAHGAHRRPRIISGHKVRWTTAAELSSLMNSDPDMVALRLIDEESSTDRVNRLTGELDVTLSELEEALPWIPRDSRLTICRPGGIDADLERRLIMILRGREALLFSTPVVQMPEKLHAIAGELCS